MRGFVDVGIFSHAYHSEVVNRVLPWIKPVFARKAYKHSLGNSSVVLFPDMPRKVVPRATVCFVHVAFTFGNFDHNRFVGWLWDSIQEFGDKPCEDNPVMLTDAYFKSIHAILKEVKVPIDRWSKDHYIDRMEAMFGIMTGNDADGIEFGSAPLTPEQAGSVIWLMDAMFGIDQHQADLEVPKGCDYLLANEDYHWCENCGAVTYEDTHYGKDGDIACDFCESDNQEEEE